MNDKLDIYFSKVFCRMRHKTQLFNGAADDHYHTRLQHTIEVEEIALRIAKRIIEDNPKIKCDLSKVSAIALLHDIGHTPFGHAGEKALHEIVSGQCSKEYGLPDFKKLGIAIGFKHNINSGLLYIENRGFDKADIDILDGIVKHTRLTQDENDGLDYGFEYIFHDISKTYLDYYSNQLPKTIEGFIVAYADEIAQVCSDYLDICLDAKSKDKQIEFTCPPYNELRVQSSEKRYEAVDACKILEDLFVKDFPRDLDYSHFKETHFYEAIKIFDSFRYDVIHTNDSISQYDSEKKDEIKSLFAHYFKHPEDLTNDFFGDFVYRLKRTKLHSMYMYSYLEFLSANKEEVINFIHFIKNAVINGDNVESNNKLRDFRSLLKVFIRSVAVHISKMTDNYAHHKFVKCCTKNVFRKFLTKLTLLLKYKYQKR